MLTPPRRGILGGAFDPPHLGHLLLAEYGREALHLEQVLFVPTAAPPHKGAPVASATQRYTMTALAIADHAGFGLSDIELRRAGPSYTIDTIRALQDAQGTDRFALLLGGDQLADLTSWRDWQALLAACTLVAAARPGCHWDAVSPEIMQQVVQVPMPVCDIASRDIRRRVAEGWSIRYLVPEAVRMYIAEEGLYRDREAGVPGPAQHQMGVHA